MQTDGRGRKPHSGLEFVARLDASVEKDAATASYQVEPVKEGDAGGWEYVAVARVPSAGPDVVGRSPAPLDVRFETAHLAVVLLDGEARSSLAHVRYQVEGTNPPLAGDTDERGFFFHPNVPSAYYRVKVDGRHTVVVPTVRDPGRPYPAEVRDFRPKGVLSVRVVDHRTRRPLAGVPYRIACCGEGLTGAADQDGRLRHEDVSVGPHTLSLEGFGNVAVSAEPAPGRLLVVPIRPRLDPGGPGPGPGPSGPGGPGPGPQPSGPGGRSGEEKP